MINGMVPLPMWLFSACRHPILPPVPPPLSDLLMAVLEATLLLAFRLSQRPCQYTPPALRMSISEHSSQRAIK